MAKGYYDRVIAELKALGYVHARSGKGSHEIWRGANGHLITVPHNLKSRHTANGILKSCGSSRKI